MKLSATGFILISLFLLVTVGLFNSCDSDQQIEFKRYYSSGSLVYQTNCQNCHGAHGEGLQVLVPPLTDSVFLQSNNKKLSCIVKYGLSGKVVVHDKTFEGKMPANDLSPIQIAGVLTYIKNSFGNKSETVTNQRVLDDLKNCN